MIGTLSTQVIWFDKHYLTCLTISSGAAPAAGVGNAILYKSL